MSTTIVNRSSRNYQLVTIAIDLVHVILNIKEIYPELIDHPQIAKVSELANKWNNTFIDIISSTTEGGK